MSERPRRADRGVSEVLGFVLIFALITSSVGVVYVVGFDGLVGARDYERLNNAERAFDVLADNVEDITNRRAPSRATEIKLADAGLEMGDPVVVNVTGVGTDGTADFNAEYAYRPIVYDAGTGTRIVYSGGAVIRTQGDAGVMVGDPHFVLDDRVVIPVIQTRATGANDVHGSSTALIRTEHAGTELAVGTSAGTYDVTLNVTTPRAEVWRHHLTAEFDVDCPPGDNGPGKVSCTVTGADAVYVTAVRIDVAFE